MFGALRTILAFNVVLLHIFNVPLLGNYSVTFFFLLSGFLMTLIMDKTYGFDRRGFSIFWTNRALRLYPSYFLLIILTVLLLVSIPDRIPLHQAMKVPSSFSSWISNLSMIYPDLVPHRIVPRLAPPTWALTNELCFYLLISLGISRSKFRTIIWVILSSLYFIGTYLFYDLGTFRYSAIPAASLPFSLGAYLYHINKQVSPLSQKTNAILALLSVLLFYMNAFLKVKVSFFPEDFHLYANLFIAASTVHFLYNLKIERLLKADKFIGYFSYPVYLFHYQFAVLYYWLLNLNYPTFKIELAHFIPFSALFLLGLLPLIYFVDMRIDRLKEIVKKLVV